MASIVNRLGFKIRRVSVRSLNTSSCTHNQTGVEPKPHNEIPATRQVPILGSLGYTLRKYALTDSHKAFVDNAKEYGPIYRDKVFQMKMVTLTSVAAAEDMFRNEGKYPKRFDLALWRKARESRQIPLSVFLSNGEDWHHNRRAVDKPLLILNNIYKYIDPLNKVNMDFIALLDDAQNRSEGSHVPEIRDMLFRWSLESVGYFLYDFRLGCLANPPIPEGLAMINAVEDIFKASLRMISLPVWLARLAMPRLYKKHQQGWNTAFDISHKYIKQRLDQLELDRRNGKEETGFLAKVTQDNPDMSVKVLEAIVSELMFAGIDTTTYTVLWLLYHLSTNSKSKEKVLQEIRQYVGPNQVVNEAYIRNASYLKACLKESMRLAPVVLNISRMLPQDTPICGYKINADHMVIANCGVMAVDENNFDNATQFIPERWIADRQSRIKGTGHSSRFTSLPFGFGARGCVGRRLAELEMYLFVANLLNRYDVKCLNDEPVDGMMAFLYVPKTEVKLQLIAR